MICINYQRQQGAKVVNNLDAMTDKDLGSADLVEERRVETDKWVFIEGCKNPKAVTILIRVAHKELWMKLSALFMMP